MFLWLHEEMIKVVKIGKELDQNLKTFWRLFQKAWLSFELYHIGSYWKELTKSFKMNTNVTWFRWLFSFLQMFLSSPKSPWAVRGFNNLYISNTKSFWRRKICDETLTFLWLLCIGIKISEIAIFKWGAYRLRHIEQQRREFSQRSSVLHIAQHPWLQQ